MTLDPTIARFLAQAAETMAPLADPGLDIAARRRLADQLGAVLHRQVAEPGPDVAEVVRHSVPVPGGTVGLICYLPAGAGPFPGHVLLHGGGWWQGSVEDWISDVQARERCAGTGTVVVAVEYRLAPEHPFPVPVEDCRAAWLWVLEHADELGIDPARVSLGGVSAGGNLAAATCLMLRDRGETLPALQLLEAPAMDFSLDRPSMQLGPEYGIDSAGFGPMVRMYLPDPADEQHPYAAPGLAPDLSGLPPAHILTGEFDLLRDGGEAYAARLEQAGVPVRLTRHAGHIHVSPGMTKILPAARAWRSEVLESLRRVASIETAR